MCIQCSCWNCHTIAANIRLVLNNAGSIDLINYIDLQAAFEFHQARHTLKLLAHRQLAYKLILQTTEQQWIAFQVPWLNNAMHALSQVFLLKLSARNLNVAFNQKQMAVQTNFITDSLWLGYFFFQLWFSCCLTDIGGIMGYRLYLHTHTRTMHCLYLYRKFINATLILMELVKLPNCLYYHTVNNENIKVTQETPSKLEKS